MFQSSGGVGPKNGQGEIGILMFCAGLVGEYLKVIFRRLPLLTALVDGAGVTKTVLRHRGWINTTTFHSSLVSVLRASKFMLDVS